MPSLSTTAAPTSGVAAYATGDLDAAYAARVTGYVNVRGYKTNLGLPEQSNVPVYNDAAFPLGGYASVSSSVAQPYVQIPKEKIYESPEI